MTNNDMHLYSLADRWDTPNTNEGTIIELHKTENIPISEITDAIEQAGGFIDYATLKECKKDWEDNH